MRIVTSRKGISTVFDPLGKEKAVILRDRTISFCKDRVCRKLQTSQLANIDVWFMRHAIDHD